MNIDAYILSGKLEEYLLGLLPESEAREVEQVAAAYPEVRAELRAMEDALRQYAVAKGVPMPAGLPGRIVQSIDALEQPQAGTAVKPTSPARGRVSIAWLGLLLAASVAGVLFFWWSNRQLRGDLQQNRLDLQRLQVQCEQTQADLEQAQLQLAILRSEGTQTFIMRGNEKSPGAIANVYYNTQSGTTYLDIRQLDAPPAGMQYQLWGIGLAGAQSLDVFDLPQGGEVQFISVPFLPGIQVFAVSLEPVGGSPQPTDVRMMS